MKNVKPCLIQRGDSIMAGIIRAYSLAKDGERNVSKNFKVREFKCKDGSDTIFIADELVTVLQKIRDRFGKAVTINSAYRTDAYNKKIGGAAYSQHKYGCAADIVVSGVKPIDVYTYADSILPNGGVGKYDSFTHVDVRGTKSRF